MSLDNDNAGRGRMMMPLERARLVSEALADAARRARFSSRSRRQTHGGFGAREGQVLMKFFISLTFWLMVVLPTVAGVVYFGWLASDRFEAEIKFTVTGAEAPMVDGFGALTGLPSADTIQDTQIVANHLQSRAAVEALEKKVGLRSLYSASDVDWLSRFNGTKPIERLVKYWQSMAHVAIQMPAGIVSVRVQAFTPAASHDIAAALIEISEKLINDLNDRMNRDTLTLSESELERASQRLMQARLNIEKARNDEGVLDATRAAEGIARLITETRSQLLLMQQEYRTQLRVVSESAPQMQNLRARINALEGQIADLESQLTRRDAKGNPTLSASMLRFSALELERQIAEKLYAGAVASLEVARMNAERKKMYLNTFVAPSIPQEARYPKRGLSIFLTVIGSLALWGCVVGGVVLVRNHMA